MQEQPTSSLIDPMTAAAAQSVGFTPQMHKEAHHHLFEQIYSLKGDWRQWDSHVLDLYEMAIYHAAYSDQAARALNLYDEQLGGYQFFGATRPPKSRPLTARLLNLETGKQIVLSDPEAR